MTSTCLVSSACCSAKRSCCVENLACCSRMNSIVRSTSIRQWQHSGGKGGKREDGLVVSQFEKKWAAWLWGVRATDATKVAQQFIAGKRRKVGRRVRGKKGWGGFWGGPPRRHPPSALP